MLNYPYLGIFALNCSAFTIQYIYRKMPQFASTFFSQCVFCEHVSFTDISIIIADFLCQESSHDVYRHWMIIV